MARLEPAVRETIPALLVADDGHRHRGAGFPGADEHAFHRPFFRGAHKARHRRLGTSLSVKGHDPSLREHNGPASQRQTQQESQPHRTLLQRFPTVPSVSSSAL